MAGLLLLGGMALLAAAVVAAVVRHNHSVAAREARQRARYDEILRSAAARPPRFRVTLVEFPLSKLPQLVRRGPDDGHPYEIVPTAVAVRIRTGRPPLHPDFGLLRPPRYLLKDVSEAFRERRVRELDPSVWALVVAQTTPGKVAAMRLDAVRGTLPAHSFQDVYDVFDVTSIAGTGPFKEKRAKMRSPEVIRWAPRGGAVRALLPLAVLNDFEIPRTPGNEKLIHSVGGTEFEIVTSFVLAPRKLSLRRPGGQEIVVPIGKALDQPLILWASA